LMLMLILIGLVLFIRYFLVRSSTYQYYWHWAILHMPIFGSVVKRILITRFTRLLSVIYRIGFPLPQGIREIGAALNNIYVRQQLEEVSIRLEKGDNLSKAGIGFSLFPPMVLEMLQVGEESGMLSEMLIYIAEFYEQEVD